MPLVSVVIPARNEEKFIGGCLKSLVEEQTDYPKEGVEILVVDGGSQDKTRKIVNEYIQKYPNIRLLMNEKKFTPFGLNIGIKEANGEIIIRADAHTQYPNGYIGQCVFYLTNGYKREKVDNVGGVVTVPSLQDISTIVDGKMNQIKARAIAISMSHPFGAASRFRIGSKEPIFVDTVFGGCFKKEIFKEIGLFNENLKRSQDLEFNLRLQRAGKKILLIPQIQFRYYPKLNFREFFLHNFEDGIWAIYPLKFTKKPFKLRHYIPLIFILTLPLSIWPYFLISLLFSLQITIREKDLRFLPLMFMAFACRHFGYGLGSLRGIIKIFKD